MSLLFPLALITKIEASSVIGEFRNSNGVMCFAIEPTSSCMVAASTLAVREPPEPTAYNGVSAALSTKSVKYAYWIF